MPGDYDLNELDKIDLTQQGAFELIEFTLKRQIPEQGEISGLYGINVSKVREVVRMPKINPLSSKIAGVAGVFELRGVPIPAINLSQALGDRASPINPNHQIIVAEFGKKRAGFIVDQTHRIRRVAWDQVLPPTADSGTFISGMILIEDSDFLFILDLEKIVGKIEALDSRNSMEAMGVPGVGSTGPRRKMNRGKLLVVDDSQLIRANVVNTLANEGFQVVQAENGIQAIDILENVGQDADYSGIQMVITDIEMPQMDGISLCNWIKDSPSFCQLPVIIHSSLSGDAMQQSAVNSGADTYVVKNDMRDLLKKVNEFLSA